MNLNAIIFKALKILNLAVKRIKRKKKGLRKSIVTEFKFKIIKKFLKDLCQ